MSNTRVSEAIARPTRTALQAAPAWVITEGIDAWLYDMDDRQFGVTVLLLTMVGSWVQALVENHIGKGLLRQFPAVDVPAIEE